MDDSVGTDEVTVLVVGYAGGGADERAGDDDDEVRT
jgi:hypothetical protein